MSLPILKPVIICVTLGSLFGCATKPMPERVVNIGSTAKPISTGSSRSLASYKQPSSNQQCHHRAAEPFAVVVDMHFHPRPFRDQAKSPKQLLKTFDEMGIRFADHTGFVTSLGIGPACTSHLDCPGVSALPSIKNDFVNSLQLATHPEVIIELIEPYGMGYPGMLGWAQMGLPKELQRMNPNQHLALMKERLGKTGRAVDSL